MDNSAQIKECENNYSREEYLTYFFESDEGINKCNRCPHLEYKDGISRCTLYDK